MVGIGAEIGIAPGVVVVTGPEVGIGKVVEGGNGGGGCPGLRYRED